MIQIKYTLTQKNLYEYVIGVLLKNLLLFGFSIGIFGIFFFTMLFPNTTLMVISILCLVTTLILPFTTVWEINRNQHALHGTSVTETTLTFADTIQMTETNFNLEVNYQQIIKTVQTKHLYAFMLGKNNGIVVPKNQLSQEDYDTILTRISQ